MMRGANSDYLRGICRLGDGLLIYLDVRELVKASTTFIRQDAALQEMPTESSVTAN
jgi:chemotaxis signal transduction protein